MAPTIGMQTMPTLTVLAVVGLALVALLFIANAKLEPVSPVITTSQRLGLPNSPGRTQNLNGATQNHTAAPAPAPDMSSPAVLAAQPKSGSDAAAKFGSAAREARAEAPTKKALGRNVSQQDALRSLTARSKGRSISQESPGRRSATPGNTTPERVRPAAH